MLAARANMIRAATRATVTMPRAAARAFATRTFDAAERAAAVYELARRGWVDQAPERDAVTKQYEFRDFDEAWGWMSRVALEAGRSDHHPEWTNVYSTVTVTLATHSAGGLSPKDTKLAAYCDRAALGGMG